MTSARLCLLFALVGILALQIAPCVSQQATRTPSGAARRADLSDPYSPRIPARARAYHRVNWALTAAGILWRVAGLLLFLRAGASARCRDIAERLAGRLSRRRGPRPERSAPAFSNVAAYYVLFSGFMMLWMLPIGLTGLAVEHRFGFSSEGLPLFLKDHIVSLCIGWTLIPVIWFTYRVYSWRPASWWLILWCVLAPIGIIESVVYPVAIAPLYNKYTPLAPGRLRDDLLRLAARAGIHNARVLVEDTSRRSAHVNAYVAGIGPTTRIVLNDTALKELPEDQIVAMMGHEMGHYVEGHVLINALVGALGTGLILALLAAALPPLVSRFRSAYGIRGMTDPAALALVMLVLYVVGLAGEPASSAISRTLEERADDYGLRATGLSDATARLMVGFAERDLGDPNPPWLLHFWFGTHPTLAHRIAHARSYGRTSDVGPSAPHSPH